MYFLNKNKIAIIERKLHIINNLIIKALIDIDIIKSKRIIINLNNDIIKVNIYNNIEVSIVAIIKRSFISAIVYNSKRVIILAYFNVVVLITKLEKVLKLLNDRDLLFEL